LDRPIQDDAMHGPRFDLPLEAQEVESHQHVRRLMLFFAVVYAGEGIGQTGRLIAQPLNYFLKEVHGWSPVQISAYLTALNVPWLIKPVYGLVSDFLPVFGYRRKIYLLGVNAAALAALCWATQIVAPSDLFVVLLLTAYAMAISSTLCGAILVENGQKFSASGNFIHQEWLWFNVSSIAALLMGGQLVQRFPPTSALHIATGLVALAPSAVIVVTLLLITETKNTINLGELKKSFRGLIAALKTPTLWIVGLFLFFYYFSPGFATPLYYHLTDELRFSQAYIGILGSVASGGWIIGALTYQFFQPIGFAPPAQSKHFTRHHVISLVSSAIRRGERSCSLFLQRFRRDGVASCNTHAGGRALSIAIRGFRLRDLVINHQFCDYGCRSRWLIYLRPCVHQEPCPTYPAVRHLYGVCICPSPPPASRRNTGSQYLLAIPQAN